MALTTITCLTCTSTVPWGPHCPQCGAYLEFAGDPPWMPTPEGYVPPQQEAVETEVEMEFAASVPVTAPPIEAPRPSPVSVPPQRSGSIIAPVAVLITGAIVTPLLWWGVDWLIGLVAAIVFIAWAAVLVPRPASDAPAPSSPGYTASIAVLILGAIAAPLLWWQVDRIIGVGAAIVCLAWAIVLWPRRAEVAPAQPDVIEVVEVEEIVVEVEEIVVEADPLEVLARAPQALPRRTVEATRALGLKDPRGELPCSNCARLNTVDRHYCLWCGTVMAEATIAPSTIAHEVQARVEGPKPGKRRRRGPSRSWRSPILVLTLSGVLFGSIIFAMFGPNAFRVRFGITQVYQVINTFINPLTGDQADVESVTASSTLRGTSARDAAGSDAAVFWASQPSEDQGVGESILYTFDGLYTINRMVILPGIQNGIFDPRSVATPHEITLTFDDGTEVKASLNVVQNNEDLQQLVSFAKVTTRTVTLTIDSVYPPRVPSEQGSSEVAISGTRFLAPPEPPQIIDLPTDVQPRTSLPGMTS